MRKPGPPIVGGCRPPVASLCGGASVGGLFRLARCMLRDRHGFAWAGWSSIARADAAGVAGAALQCPHGGSVCWVGAAVCAVSWFAASVGVGRAGGVGVFDASGGVGASGGFDTEPGVGGIAFLYEHVLGRPLEEAAEFVRAKRPERLPVVLSAAEVARVLGSSRGCRG
jgi:hypothetical protein